MTMFPSSVAHQNINLDRENPCYPISSNYINGGGRWSSNHNSDHPQISNFDVMNYNYYQGYDYCCSTSSTTITNNNNIHNLLNIGDQYSMADQQDDSRTETESSTHVNEEAAAPGSSSKDILPINLQDDHNHEIDKDDIDQEEGKGWLQLSIGSHRVAVTQYHHNNPPPNENKHQQSRRGDDDHHNQLLELHLLPPGGLGGWGEGGSSLNSHSHSQQPIITGGPAAFHQFTPPAAPLPTTTNFFTSSRPSLVLQHYYPGSATTSPSTSFPHPQEISWATFRSNSNINIINPTNINVASSSSSSWIPPVPSYSTRPFHPHGGGIHVRQSEPSLDFRVVDPPRRPQSGIWFMLQASQIQAKEPFLPQIPKSYLRIKNGQMTVRLVIKYLVNKLRLESESEVEIRCRGQQLLPMLTLQHVRDSVWRSHGPREEEEEEDIHHYNTSSSSSSSSSDHLMVLHYGRSTAS